MFGSKFRRLNDKLKQVLHFTKGIDMKVSELAGVLNTLVAQVEKIRAEVQALKDSLANVDLPEAATTALANLDTALKGVDDITPDA